MTDRRPTPWSVEYRRRYSEWHEKSCPYIADALGAIVVEMPQNVRHPGLYDELADNSAHQIVDAVNYRAQQKEWATWRTD